MDKFKDMTVEALVASIDGKAINTVTQCLSQYSQLRVLRISLMQDNYWLGINPYLYGENRCTV